MSSHRILATLKNYQKHTPRRSSTRARPWWKMLKNWRKFRLPIAGASGTNQSIGANGICRLIWSMPTMIRNKTKSSSQQRSYRHLSMTFTNRHQLTTEESVQSLPMKSPTPLTLMALPLMRMVAWKTGGSQKITKPLLLAHKKLSINLKAKTHTVPRSTGNWPFLKT